MVTKEEYEKIKAIPPENRTVDQLWDILDYEGIQIHSND